MSLSSRATLRGLYVITDERLMPEARFDELAETALSGGASVIQYRDKSADLTKREHQAARLRELCEQYNAVLIINDDINLARSVEAHGIHIGVNDMSYEDARDALGENAIIGVSCYANFERARLFAQMGADYVAFGAFFASPTKPQAANASLDLLQRARQELEIPVCAIGGVTAENASLLVEAGAEMVATISGVFADEDTLAHSKRIASLFPGPGTPDPDNSSDTD
jgi:thiamine-phosphate pyrophosphorylase